MSNAHRRRTIAALVAVVATFALGACSMKFTGFDAQTNQQYQAGVGADARDTDVQVLGALLVVNGDDTATLSATLINTTGSVQQLTGIRVADNTGAEVLVRTTRDLLDLPVGRAVQLGTEGGKVAVLAAPVDAGLYFTLTLSFAGAADVEIRIPSVVRNSTHDIVVGPSADPADDDAEAETGGH